MPDFKNQLCPDIEGNETDRGPQATGSHSADRQHEGGSPLLDGDAQYGASPLRTVRYDQIHEAIEDMAEGRRSSRHHDAQARYPNADDVPSNPSTGHDEQQMSRQLADEARAESNPEVSPTGVSGTSASR